MNVLDRTISYFAPETALRRALARRSLRGFDAASRSPRLGAWGLAGQKLLERDVKALRLRARQLCDNNSYAARAVTSLVDYAVGKGLTPHSKSRRHEALLKAWADTTACDIDGRQTLYGLQALAFEHVVRDGEVWVQRIVDPGAEVPVRLKILDADYLDTSKAGRNTVQGIEYGASGERTGYWLFDRHPDDESFRTPQSKRIPASELLHIFFPHRAGQQRGVSWLAPIMLRLKDFDEYEDAELLRKKIATCLVGFFRDLEAQGED